MGHERLRGAVVVLLGLAVAVGSAQERLTELMSQARAVGERSAFANEYVSVSHTFLEYPPADSKVAQRRPVVLYISVVPAPGIVNTSVLPPPGRSRPAWYPGVMPVGVRIEVLAHPPKPPEPGEPGTDLPRGTAEDNQWEGGRLVRATFRPLNYGAGTGRYANVTTFLSDGVIEVRHRGLRRRMGVRAGEAFWFEAGTALTVVDDYPVGAAVVQLLPARGADESP